MRDRKKQRKLKKAESQKIEPIEEELDFRDQCGIKDPTPFYAVKRIVRKERIAIAKANLEEILNGNEKRTDEQLQRN